MAVFSKLQEALGRKPANIEDEIVAAPEPVDDAAVREAADIPDEKIVEDLPSENVQHGVKLAQALSLTWGKESLVAIFILYESSHTLVLIWAMI